MWIVVLLIVFVIFRGIFRLGVAICRPIFEYLYESAISSLTQSGMSPMAARAVISLVIIIFVLIILNL